MDTVEKILILLCRNQFCGEPFLENVKTIEELKSLFKLSNRYDIAHLLGDILERNGLLPDGTEVKRRFLQERNMAVYRYEQQQYEFDCICATLNAAKIPFIPLKGSVIRSFYPEPWMRTSCDIDILIKEEDLSKAVEVLQAMLKYQYEHQGNHDVSLFAESGVHLELHYKLYGSEQPWNVVLSNVWEYASSKNGYHYALSNEMFYFYHIAHMAGHFKVGGCGIRPFLDLYLIRKHTAYNQEKLTELLEQGGLIEFNKAVCALSDYWFANGEYSPIVEELENFILKAGMYGDVKNRVAIAKAKKRSKASILFSRIFLPYDRLKFQYPILQKHKILTPFYQVRRWFNLLRKDRRKQAVNELKITATEDKEKEERIARLLNNLGI